MSWRLGRYAIYFCMGPNGQQSKNGPPHRAVYPPGWGVRYLFHQKGGCMGL